MAKGKLESEGIEVIIKDEFTAQVNNFYSNAIGGVKLLVKEADFDNARLLLIESGYIQEAATGPNKFWNWFNHFTAKIPLLGRLIIEIRLIIVVAILLIIIAIPIVLLSLPSITEKLTENSWCVDRMYYKGQELVPYSPLNFTINFGNCSEIMRFRENGIVEFPGIDTYREHAHWELRNDSLIITSLSDDNNYSLDNHLKVIEKEDTIRKSIYLGTYLLKIENNIIQMQSDSMIILGQVFQLNFNF